MPAAVLATRTTNVNVVPPAAFAVPRCAGYGAAARRRPPRRTRRVRSTRPRGAATPRQVEDAVAHRRLDISAGDLVHNLAALLAWPRTAPIRVPHSEGTLLDTFLGSPGYEGAVRVPGGSSNVGALMPDGNHYVAVDDHAGIHEFDLSTGAENRRIAGHTSGA